MRVITAPGTCAGADDAIPHELTSKSLKPLSIIVGNSGAAAKRRGDAAASAMSLPALTCGSTALLAPNIHCTCPPSTAVTAGATPLNGTCVILVPLCACNH